MGETLGGAITGEWGADGGRKGSGSTPRDVPSNISAVVAPTAGNGGAKRSRLPVGGVGRLFQTAM